jgi:hypothetical protein
MRASFHRRACLGAFLVLLLNLVILSASAHAGDSGLALPIKTTSSGGGDSAQPVESAVQTAGDPVTKAVAQTVGQAAAPASETASTEAPAATASVSGAVTRAAATATSPTLDTATRTVGKTSAPVIESAAKTVDATTAPVVEATTQSVAKVTAPVVKTTDSVVRTAAPALNTAATALETTGQTLAKASAPLISRATNTIGETVVAGGGASAGEGHPNHPATTTNGLFSGATNAVPSVTSPSSPLPRSGPMPAQGSRQGVSAGVNGLLSIRPVSGPSGRFAQTMEALGALARSLAESFGRDGKGLPSSSFLAAPVGSPLLPGGSLTTTASAAGGAFPVLLTLAGLLLLGGLPAMGLLRLASEPRHKAPFVLIPERPG